MNRYLVLLKNKSVQLALGSTIGILILLTIFSPKKSVSPTTTLPSPFRPELQNVSESKRQESASYLATIGNQLPIYLDNIETSVNISTTLNIYRLPADPAETLRFEIYGISYLNPDSSELDNPNITAFRETFIHGLQQLRDAGIDPTQLIFIYGDKQYVRDTATIWVNKYHLLP